MFKILGLWLFHWQITLHIIPKLHLCHLCQQGKLGAYFLILLKFVSQQGRITTNYKALKGAVKNSRQTFQVKLLKQQFTKGIASLSLCFSWPVCISDCQVTWDHLFTTTSLLLQLQTVVYFWVGPPDQTYLKMGRWYPDQPSQFIL